MKSNITRKALIMCSIPCFLCCGCRQQDSTPAAPQTVDGQSASTATTNAPISALDTAPSPATSQRTLQKVELISWYFGHEYKVTVVEPQKLATVQGILERHEFYSLDESYRNQGVRDGFSYSISATKTDGSVKSVTVQNVPEPHFAAIQRELFETGWTMPERWYQIE